MCILRLAVAQQMSMNVFQSNRHQNRTAGEKRAERGMKRRERSKIQPKEPGEKNTALGYLIPFKRFPSASEFRRFPLIFLEILPMLCDWLNLVSIDRKSRKATRCRKKSLRSKLIKNSTI